MVRRGRRLEGGILSLMRCVCRVGRREVGMVPARRCGCHGRCHGDTEGAIGDGVMSWVVGKSSCCGRVVHTGVRETGVGKGR